MNATTDTRSAADLEREGEQIRADLDRTLDEIQHKFSSGELLDRSVEFLRNTGSELLREAGETVRRNPVPVLLTAAGLLWLTGSVASSRSGTRRDSGRHADELDSSRIRAQSDASYSPDTGEERWDSSAHGRVRNATHRMKSKVTSRLSDSVHAVQNRTYEARSQFAHLVQEQPIVMGALALAAGALLGAALPMTRYENKWVGPVHDRTMARAKEAGEREYENIRRAVSSSRERGSAQSRDTASGDGSQRSAPG